MSNNAFSGPDFSQADLGTVSSLEYLAQSDWTVQFDSPVNNLLLLARFWRGEFNFGLVDATSTYAFDLPFTILSGLGGTSVSGNTLSVPDAGTFRNGVLRFSGPVSTLSVDATVPFDFGGQILTFALETEPIPEPATVTLVATALLIAAARRRTRA